MVAAGRSSGPARARRPRRRRRAQLVPRQALRLVGDRVLPLDVREHAHDRVHREGRRRAAGAMQNELATTLLIGAVIWAYLGIIFEILTETVAWERWEGTIEYTFMAPLSRPVHLFGMGLFAVAYGVVRASLLFVVIAAFFSLHMPDANFAAALRAARDRVGLVHRDRDDDRRPAADLAREGNAARLHRAGADARRLRRLLPGVGAAAVDAVARDDLAGDLRAARDPRRDPRRRRVAQWARRLAAARDRRGVGAARPRTSFRTRRAVREAARKAEAVRDDRRCARA